MARLGSASLTGQGIALLRGGSNSLGVKSVVFSTISKEGLVSSPIQSFSNPRGESFSNFLRSVKGSDGGSVPLFPFRPLSENQTKAIKVSKANPANTEIVSAQTAAASRNRPSVIWFGSPIRNVIPENGDILQPNVVEKSISFALPRVEPIKREPVVKEQAPNINEARVDVVQEIAKSQAEVSVAEKVDAGRGEQLLPRRQLSIVEQVGLAMMVSKARMSMLKPKSQAIPMSGAETGASSTSMPATEAAPTGQTSEDKTSTSEVKVEIPKKVNQLRRKTKIIQRERKDLSFEKKRTRFVERDLDMNAWRLKALVKGYMELAAQGEVDGVALAAQSHIGSSRELRSVFLDQRGYRDRTDGSQKRMELFLGSVKAVNKEQLKIIVNEHTAVKETYEESGQLATEREVSDVVNDPNTPDTRFEPVKTEEIIEEERVTQAQAYESKRVELNPRVVDEKPVAEADIEEGREEQVVSAENLMRSVELIGHVNQIWGTIPLQRRELVLN